MALSVNTLNLLNQYITGVMERAEHHAPNVDEIALAIVGAIIWKVTDEDIQVKTYSGQMANVLWMTINVNRYALVYNHENETIEIREGSIRGNALYEFTNATPIIEIKQAFNNL